MRRRVVVTGLGVVTPMGCDVETLWTDLLAGRGGVTAPRRDAPYAPPTKAVGEMREDDLARLRAEHPEAAATGEMRTLLGTSSTAKIGRAHV